MRRVVVTGMGIWSCIGQDLQTVTENLKQGRSGVICDIKRIEYGLQSGLVGNIHGPNILKYLSRQQRQTMSEDSNYAFMAVQQALVQSNVDGDYLRQNEVGIILGNDGNVVFPENDIAYNLDSPDIRVSFRGASCSSIVNLSAIFDFKGYSFVIGGACASSSHAIGLSYLLIKDGEQDMIITGGSMERHRLVGALGDGVGILSLRNDAPTLASRPFDRDRDGMIPSGGAAALVLEEYEHAIARGATILAEVIGYGFSSNGMEDISAPSAEGEYIAMKRALDDAGIQPSDIDYVNAHATSTIAGDIEEAKALTRLFVEENKIINHQSAIINRKPYVSSTKSMTGHENWMAGASEAIYSILMMQNNFVAPNINLENVIDEAKDLNIVRETIYTPIKTVLSNSSGMGGTNSALVFRKI